MGVIRSFQGKKVYYKPQGFLDAEAVGEIITPADISLFEKKGVKYVSIDFSKIISANMNAIRFMNDIFEMLYKKNIEGCIFNANKNIKTIIGNLKNCFFHFFENEHIEKIFCDDDYREEKPIYLCCIKDDQNKNMLIYYLVKKGYNPKVINNEEEGKDGVIIKDSFVTKISNRVGAVVKNGVVYFYFDNFLDANLPNMFDIEYFRRNLLIGFRVFVFDMNQVKGLNVHAVRFLSKLGVEGAEYGALLAIVGLNAKNIQKNLLEDLEDVGFMFFANEEELLNSEEYKDALESNDVIYKRAKKITKDFVKILPYFVNATISTVELMTGVTATKEPPNIKEVTLDTSKDYVASSIGFYGDNDGVMILIFTEKLSRRISKILLGEEYQSKEDLVDMVGEFANIIVGNVKRELKKYDVDINLTLPKVFDEIENLQNIVVNRKGIEVKFYFDGEEFYFYLIR
ncbi:MAG: chemotaxis protein CheX [Epsilonproteobacteria bacterium]|nr:chemotaxis protein CheX [Campylobacterota bacterium]